MGTRKITILHANDLHGQLSFKVNKQLEYIGGVSLLSGYVKRTRTEGPTFFGICGDVLQEDVLGSDYKGTNTVELINYLAPDCLSLGNHELDYGLAHLLVFKACVQSPIPCANLTVAKMRQSLFRRSMICKIGGVRILLIGVIPKGFYDKIISDEFCRKTLIYKDTYEAIRDETARHRGRFDLVVLMSHYGIDGDRILAENMPDDLRVDLILGGHTHIDMDEAEVVNGIPIAQSSYGTTHVGRFDLAVDMQGGGIREWSWRRVAITNQTSDFDTGVDELADRVAFHEKKRQENSVRYFSMEFDESQTKLLSRSTFNDLLTWCLDRRKKIRTPESGRFILLNFEG